MAYINTSEKYDNVIYSGDATTRVILKINDITVCDLDTLPEDNKISQITKVHNIIKVGENRLSLDNFVAQDLEINIYNFDYSLYERLDLEINQYNKIELSLATLTDTIELSTITEDVWEEVPIGIFNIIATPTTDKDITTIKAKCNRVKFDILYNAKPIIDDNGGKVQIGVLLQDMCLKCGVELGTELPFINSTTEMGVYDSTIPANIYVSYICEKAGSIAVIGRDGKLYLIPINNDLYKHILDGTLIRGEGKLKYGDNFTYDRVCYEFGINKYATPMDDENNTTIYINSANPYITNQEEIDNIYDSVNGFEIQNLKFEALGNPCIDSWDIVGFTKNGVEYKTLANNTLVFNGKLAQTFDTSIGTKESVKENVTAKGEKTYKKTIKTEIDNIEAELKIQTEKIDDMTDFMKDATNSDYVYLGNTPESIGAINRLKITGFDLRELYPNMAYPSNYTFPEILSFYTLIVSAERVYYVETLPEPSEELEGKIYNEKGLTGKFYKCFEDFENNGDYVWEEYNENIKMVYVNSPHPLLNDDELIFENNKIKVIQKNAYNFTTNEWESLGTPIEYELGTVELPTYVGGTYITLKYFTNLDYYAEFIEENEFTQNYQTQVESKGTFNITSNQLVLKVDANGRIAETGLYADPKTGSRIKLKADDIELEGYTTINKKFKVKLDGSIEAIDGVFNGTVHANSGSFKGDIFLGSGAKVIGGDGILSSLQFTSFGQFDGFSLLGFAPDTFHPGYNFYKRDVAVVYSIPSNFTPVLAYVTIQHTPITWADMDNSEKIGYSRNIRLYKDSSNRCNKYFMAYGSEYEILTNNLSGSEIDTLGGGFTGGSSIGYVSNTVGSNIASHLTEKNGTLFLRTTDANPTGTTQQKNTYSIQRTGLVKATLYIIGYTKN